LLACAVAALAAGCPHRAAEPAKAEGTAAAAAEPAATPEVGGASSPGVAAVVEVSDESSARAALGKSVRVRGTARNAKLSAAVLAGGVPIYCLDRESWSDELDGQELAVEGILEWTEEFAAKTGPDGAVSTGTSGGVFAIRHSDVKAVAEPPPTPGE
jgi:hypothetical protein